MASDEIDASSTTLPSSAASASCANDPNFAIICAFFEKFGDKISIKQPNFQQLQVWLDNTDEVESGLKLLHIQLLRKTRRTVHETAWETALSKFCYSYSAQDAWEIERFGYKKSSLKVKLRILRELVESQFERNNKFRTHILSLSADVLRTQPIGRDRLGHSYWVTEDSESNLRVYQEHLDEEIWQVVATSREEMVKLIGRLKGNEVVLPSEIGIIDEDSSSNSCLVEKPPPPEEKDESGSNDSNEEKERVPNLKIKLGNGKKESDADDDDDDEEEEEEQSEEEDEVEDPKKDRKVKPLVISQFKLNSTNGDKTKKRQLDDSSKKETEDMNAVKKKRPTLLDAKREKKVSRYEKQKDETEDEDDEEQSAEDEGEEEDEDEEEEAGDEEEESEDDDDDDEDKEDEQKVPKVGDAIEEPVMIVKGEGSGKECDALPLHFLADTVDCSIEFSEEIEEEVLFVHGEGYGAECLVGNHKEDEPKATFFFGQPGCLKLSPVKKNDSIGKEGEEDEAEGDKKTKEDCNGDSGETREEEAPPASLDTPASPDSPALPVTPASPIEATAKEENGDTAKNPRKRPILLPCRKRRLSGEKIQLPSESESDLFSENVEETAEVNNDEEADEDHVGGKRPKMRCKIVNTEIRKKVETLRKEAKADTSSGSEEERPRKKIIPRRSEKKESPKVEIAEITEKDDKVKSEDSKKDLKKTKDPVIETNEKVEEKKYHEKKDISSTKNDANGEEDFKPADKEEKEIIFESKILPKESTIDIKEKKKKSKVDVIKAEEEVESREEDSKDEPNEDPLALPPTEDDKLESSSSEERPRKRGSIPRTKEISTEAEEVIPRKRTVSEQDEESKEEIVPKTRGGRGRRSQPIELPQKKRTLAKASHSKNAVQVSPKGKKPKTDKEEIKKENEKEVTKKVSKKEKQEVIEKVDAKKRSKPEKEDSLPKEDATKRSKTEEDKQSEKKKTDKEEDTRRKVGRPKGRKEKPAPKIEKEDASSEDDEKDTKKISPKTPRSRGEIDASNILDESETPVRQSRRIAQLKIREEAERRKLEEVALKQMKADLKKKKIAAGGSEPTLSEPSVPSDKDDADHSEPELKKKLEKKKKSKKEGDGWSSGTDDEQDEDEEEHFYESDRDRRRSPVLFKSDHEFSPESDLEDDTQVVPMKRARTVRKEGEETVAEGTADESCIKCGKSDHPEWILLCDKCDKGYHCSCLSPVLFYIPEGEWFCPPCQQEHLIQALESRLKEFDDLLLRRREEEEERMLAMEHERKELERQEMERNLAKAESRNKGRNRNKGGRSSRKRKNSNEDEDGDNAESEDGTDDESNSSKATSSSSSSSSATDSDDEAIYKLRKRRQINVSYRLNEYDDMIKSALKEEEDEVAGAGNLGRGKDISTIIEADKEEKMRQKNNGDGGEGEVEAEVKQEDEEPAKTGKNIDNDSGSDIEPVKRKAKPNKKSLKKKNRKLNSLDVSSEGDDSDEDFKTSSLDDDEEEDEDATISSNSDSSLEVYRRRRGKSSKKKSRRASRRCARERRKDRKFVVEDSEESDEQRPQTKKKRKDDSDYSETEEDGDEDELSEDIDSEDLCDDSTDSEPSDGAWRPSKRKKQRTAAAKKPTSELVKPKIFVKQKKVKRVDENERSFKASGVNRNRILDESEDDDSGDSGRRTRGKRFTYMEDFDDDSSDGGIKPGVKRPDTPPEEREKFIRKQEEIKRMLAEKNTEAAKAAATPTLTPIKSAGAKLNRTPEKLDSLSTVPMSVIRQAKALDVDYLQRKGESISDLDGETDFDDDDLPDDLPEDMDEEAIARMMDEEDFTVKKPKEMVTPPKLVVPTATPHSHQPQQMLQEPVRKRLPMPTVHPPLLRHPSVPPPHLIQHHHQHHPQLHNTPSSLNLLQNALSAPLGQPISRVLALPPTVDPDAGKPRGRRKKITPLRDPLQKQQAAAAASAAAAAAKPSPLSVAQAPQLYKPPPSSAGNQPSVITRMPHLPLRPPFPPEQGGRFYSPPPNQMMGHRPPPIRHGGPQQMPPLPPHHNMRPSYGSGPPPLRPSGPPLSIPGDARHPPPTRPPYGPGDQYPPPRVRHGAPIMNSYRPMYGGPGYPPGPLQPNQTPPNSIRPGGPDYPPPPISTYGPGPYGYYPPPIGVPHSAPPPPIASAVPSSVIVRPSSAAVTSHTTATTSVTSATETQPTTINPNPKSKAAPIPVQPSHVSAVPLIEPRKKLTTLETFNPSKSATPPSLAAANETGSRSPYSSNPPPDGSGEDSGSPAAGGPAEETSEFSGLVSYFSSQHDDFDT